MVGGAPEMGVEFMFTAAENETVHWPFVHGPKTEEHEN